MNGKITLAIEVFENACDDAIQELGTHRAVQLMNHRIERYQIIQSLAPKEKYEPLFTRGVSEEELAARSRSEENRARELFRQEFEKATAPPDAEWSPAPLDI